MLQIAGFIPAPGKVRVAMADTPVMPVLCLVGSPADGAACFAAQVKDLDVHPCKPWVAAVSTADTVTVFDHTNMQVGRAHGRGAHRA